LPSPVIVKNPANFIGSALGESEKQTKSILASTVGKVLVIDEVCFDYQSRRALTTLIRRICFMAEGAEVLTSTRQQSSTPSWRRCRALLEKTAAFYC
jgi:hypothetical protein